MTDATITATAADATASELAALARSSSFAWSPDAKRLGGLLRWVVFAFSIYILGEITCVMFVGSQLFTPYDLTTYNVDPDTPDFGFMGVALLGTVYLALNFGGFIVCVILVGFFVYRATRNLRLSNARGVDIGPAWAVGWYFIPFANLVKPFQSMKEIWISSHDPERAAGDAPSTLSWWWGCWLGANFIANASTAMSNQAGADPSMLKVGYAIDAVSSAPSIIAAILLMGILRQIARAQDRQLEIAAF